jgi:hypothetical protein
LIFGLFPARQFGVWRTSNFQEELYRGDFMAESRSVSELGFKSTYLRFIEQEGIPVHKGFFVKHIRKVELAPWSRVGGLGAYLNLEGSEGVRNAYICEIPPGNR